MTLATCHHSNRTRYASLSCDICHLFIQVTVYSASNHRDIIDIILGTQHHRVLAGTAVTMRGFVSMLVVLFIALISGTYANGGLNGRTSKIAYGFRCLMDISYETLKIVFLFRGYRYHSGLYCGASGFEFFLSYTSKNH